MATVHASSARQTIPRLVTLIKKDIRAREYSENFIYQMIADNIDFIIFMEDYKVKEIVKISYDKEKKQVVFQASYERRVVEKDGEILNYYSKGEEKWP